MIGALIPIFRVADAITSAGWYARLGFEITGKHRFAPDLPLFLFLERAGVQLYLSEHKGDAPKRSLAYFWVDDVDSVATDFGVKVSVEPWGREATLADPDGNRIRVATKHPS